MKLSDLYKILEYQESSKLISLLENEDFKKYVKAVSKKGNSVRFEVTNDLIFIFSKKHLYTLYSLFAKGALNEIELNYIVDIIIGFVESYESEDVLERLEQLTDPEVNGHLSIDYVTHLMKVFEYELD